MIGIPTDRASPMPEPESAPESESVPESAPESGSDNAGPSRPLRLAVVDDFAVVVAGVARLMEPFRDRVDVVELDANKPVSKPVDIALVDTFAQGEAHTDEMRAVLDNPLAGRVVIYTWRVDEALVTLARERGFSGYLTKQLGAEELVDALESIHAGADGIVTSSHANARPPQPERRWPGIDDGLSEREAEVLVFITAGNSNAEIAERLYLSQNSIKTYIRSLYLKIAVKRRTQAVLWGIDHGFRVEHRRLDDWRQA